MVHAARDGETGELLFVCSFLHRIERLKRRRRKGPDARLSLAADLHPDGVPNRVVERSALQEVRRRVNI